MKLVNEELDLMSYIFEVIALLRRITEPAEGQS